MRVIIVEDEQSVAQNLCDILGEIDPKIEILAILETIKDTVTWIETNETPDLGLFDIRIADGNSFEIFEKVAVNFPIVFTTAFDEFALRAFKVNSIDYLMKPIKKAELKHALDKYEAIYTEKVNIDNEQLRRVLISLQEEKKPKFKRSFLVYQKDKIIPVATDRIAYFCLENDRVFCLTHKNEKYGMDQTLDKVQKQVNPTEFYRANRQFIVARKAVDSASVYFQRKLKLTLKNSPDKSIIISKLKITEFKRWLEGE